MGVFTKWKARARETAPPYAMERTGEDSAEIVLYGDIVSERPFDWQGNPIEGQYIILSEFLRDLERIEGAARLTVRIHSVGGNAYDAMTIHNRLKALKAQVKVIVDGVAMSGGAMIMCAGDTVQVFPGSLIMIHKCFTYAYGNADELRRVADGNDAMDRSQAAIYQAKTGIDTQQLLSMMEAETYMTGQEAVDKGFADGLAEGSDGLEVAASADRRTLFAGGRPVWFTSRKDGIPAVIPTVNHEALARVAINTKQPVRTGGQNGGKTMANTLDELRKENPILVEQLMAEAKAAAACVHNSDASASQNEAQPAAASDVDPVQAERQRLQDIDALACLYDNDTIQAAKYGPTACTAQEMAYYAAQKAARQGRNYLGALESDTAASGAQQVGAAASTGADEHEGLSPQQLMAKGRADAKALAKPEKEDE